MGDGGWGETLAFLGEARFDDLLLPGRIERGHRFPIVRPWSFDVYLTADLGCLHLRLSDGHGSLDLTVTPQVVPDADWLEDDEEFVLSSAEPQLLGFGRPVRCTGARYWTNGESDLGAGRVRCLELSFGSADRLVFDAMRIDGIRIGTGGAAELWLDADIVGGPFTEHTWQAAGCTGEG